MSDSGPALTLVLARPRGFCAGVVRAIQIVEAALQQHGPPVYVRHEIVHNKRVVTDLEARGACFVEDLSEVPPGGRVVFSAHGVPKSVPVAAQEGDLLAFDATCPLVAKVHREVERQVTFKRHVLLIGHRGHPETIGTMGQTPAGTISLIETIEDIHHYAAQHPEEDGSGLAYATQTTLSVSDTARMIEEMKRYFPKIAGPKQEDICYATTNRQQAVRDLAPTCEAMIIVGAPNSSNSRRLVEVALEVGCPDAFLIESADDIIWDALAGVSCVGLSAGASAPEALVQEVIAAFESRFQLIVKEQPGPEETTVFKLPRELAGESPSVDLQAGIQANG